MSSISIVATGDSFITQRLPQDEYFAALKKYIEAHDARLTNFEVLLHDFEVYPAPVSGGTWAAARPDVLQDIKMLGFNMMAWANNHTIDWNIGGMLTTMRHLDDNKCLHAGVGINLAEAAQPRYLDTPGGRVALIGVTSTMSEWGMASEQRPDVLGRPGANVLRYQAIHKVRPEDFAKLKEIVEQTEVNANRILDEREGFKKPVVGGYYVGNIRFEPGEQTRTITKMNEKDAARIVRSIRAAARQADVVLVSHHTHERKGLDKDRPADFARDFAKLCIDSGAHAYIGHGPHIWRGIEIYKQRPIFYSLGDFIFQNDSVERQPTEFYDLYDLEAKNTVSDGLDARSANETRGLVVDRKVYESAMVSFIVRDGAIDKVTVTPISLGFNYGRSRRGRPQFADKEHGVRILRDIADLSVEFGTQLAIEDGVGIITLK